ncbi:MAG: single-stranded DNA-binding protein [Hominilimicola sp.]
MNKALLMGRLTRDVEMRQTPNGVSVARFTLAVNRRFKNAEGNYDADFINCVAWRQTGEFISRYSQKGSMIGVVGSIQSRSWDGQDGKKQYATEVNVEEAYFTGSKSESGQHNQTPQNYNQAPQQQGFGDDSDMDGFNDIDGDEDLPF